MAEINFKELYLTEYTRLVNAIHRAFSETEGLETIEDLADYFRDLSIKSKATLDLNNATWNGNVCTYNANGFEITVVRDPDVVAENIREKIVIDGVEGTLVDLTSADWGERPDAASIDTGVIIKWFDGASIEPIEGTGGTARESGKVFTFDDFYETNDDGDSVTLKSDHSKAYSAFIIEERSLKNTDLTIDYNGSTMTLTVPRGMTLNEVSREINRLTDSEQSDLQGKLLWGQSFLGVTSNDPNNINTRVVVDAEVMTAKDVKSGKKGFVNGKAIEGNMQPLGDPLSWNESGVSPGVITIPAGHYTDAAHTYTFTNIEPSTLKAGSSIEFDGTTITGSLETVTYDDYEGTTNIQLGSEMPENLATENRHVQSDIRFNLDADTITSSNIRYGARVLGVDGDFSYGVNDPDSNQLYVTLDDQTTTLDSGEEVYKSPDIKVNYSAFINGKRVIGTSTTLSEGQTMNAPQIELNENFPTIENVDGKQMVGNIQFILDGDVISPSNIRSGATILGTEGTFTNIEGNAATASDILSGQRAYVNGAEITGTMPNNGSPTLKAAWNTGTSLDGGYYGSIEVAPVRMYDQGNLVQINDEIASRIQTGVTIGTSNATSITGTGNLVVEARQMSDISRVHNKIGTVIKIVNSFGNYQQGSTYIIASNGEIRQLIDSTTLNQATAESDNVLSAKKYYSNYGSLGTGTMPNKTGWTATLSSAKEVVVPKGYHDGTQKVSVDTNNWAGVIKQGESLLGVQGTYTPELETATLINNGTHYPMSGDGFSHVTVSVPEKKIGAKVGSITANGTYNITDTNNNPTNLDGWNTVEVNVPLEETTFDANGEFPYSGTGGWKKVTVAVPLGEETFTTNGDYSHPNGGWSMVHVDVQPRLQTKIMTAPVVGSELVAPDEGYDGLSSVTVQAPSYSLQEYEIGPDTWEGFQSGTTTITPPSDKIGFSGITLQAGTYIISDVDPYQGTATASDILFGKTAIVGGSSVTGIMGPSIQYIDNYGIATNAQSAFDSPRTTWLKINSSGFPDSPISLSTPIGQAFFPIILDGLFVNGDWCKQEDSIVKFTAQAWFTQICDGISRESSKSALSSFVPRNNNTNKKWSECHSIKRSFKNGTNVSQLIEEYTNGAAIYTFNLSASAFKFKKNNTDLSSYSLHWRKSDKRLYFASDQAGLNLVNNGTIIATDADWEIEAAGDFVYEANEDMRFLLNILTTDLYYRASVVAKSTKPSGDGMQIVGHPSVATIYNLPPNKTIFFNSLGGNFRFNSSDTSTTLKNWGAGLTMTITKSSNTYTISISSVDVDAPTETLVLYW